jgi:hypothetical protein
MLKQFIVNITTTSTTVDSKLIKAESEAEAFQEAKATAMKLYGPNAEVQLVSVVPMNPFPIDQLLLMTELGQAE